MKLTPSQSRVLTIAKRDGSIIIGGIDGTPGVRRDVVRRLANAGLLQWKAPRSFYEESEWILTDLGRQVLKVDTYA